MTWLEFIDACKESLPLDKNRLGIQDYIPRMIRTSLVDLQQLIPRFRFKATEVQSASDMADLGDASTGFLPDDSQFLIEVWLITSDGARHGVRSVDWSRRYELINGEYPVDDLNGAIAVDPHSSQFVFYPQLADDWKIQIHYTEVASQFQDDDVIPLNSVAADCVADFVKGTIAREVERDSTLSESYLSENLTKPGSYVRKRRRLYLDPITGIDLTAMNTHIGSYFKTGSQALVQDAITGSVSFLLDWVPSSVQLTVRKPSNGYTITASLVGTPTATGFDFALSGAPDTATYYLEYTCSK